jgi:hypothetical protein
MGPKYERNACVRRALRKPHIWRSRLLVGWWFVCLSVLLRQLHDHTNNIGLCELALLLRATFALVGLDRLTTVRARRRTRCSVAGHMVDSEISQRTDQHASVQKHDISI